MMAETSAVRPCGHRYLHLDPVVQRLARLLALVALCGLAGLRFNFTGSLPVGLYRVTRGVPSRGGLVLVCLPVSVAAFAMRRGYVQRGGPCASGLVPVGKRIYALPGDTVTVTVAGLVVNRTLLPNSESLDLDHVGRRLPRLNPGRYPVGTGTLWVLSPYSPFSFDSRYFGPIEISAIQTGVRPLWTRSGPR